MTKKKVVLDRSYYHTPFGDPDSTITNLLDGKTALKKDNLFDLNIPFASFIDNKYRDLKYSFAASLDKIDLSNIKDERVLFIYASAKGDLSGLEASFFGTEKESNTSPLLDIQAKQITDILGLSSPHTIVISNACASGQIALETAKELLQSETFDIAIVAGFDALYKFTTSGFNSLSALSPDSGAKPFDINRNGLTMGECFGLTVLNYRVPKTGDIIISGAGSSNDANHRTGPSRTGDGLFQAMNEALRDASSNSEQVAAVKCHGTSTNYNDAMEAKALFSLFGENCPPAASLKGAMGHMSGGGSLVEVLIASQILKQQKMPPTFGFEKIGVEEPISISSSTQEIHGNLILCLAAGFGGLNSALILEEIK